MQKIKLLSYIFLSTLILAIIFVISKQKNNEAQIDKIIDILRKENYSNRDSLVSDLKIRQFKEEFYLNQQSIQSDWIIAYVTILFGIFGIIGFTFFVKKIDDVEDKIGKKVVKQDENYNIHKQKLVELEKKNHIVSANLYTTIAEYNHSKGLYGIAFVHSLRAGRIITESFENEEEKKSAIANLVFSKDLINRISQSENIEQLKQYKSEIDIYLENLEFDFSSIQQTKSKEISDLFVQIKNSFINFKQKNIISS